MLNRRAFIHAAALAAPLAGCATRNEPPTQEQTGAIGNLNREQMDAAERDAAQFEGALEAVRKFDVAYAVEPRFFPSV